MTYITTENTHIPVKPEVSGQIEFTLSEKNKSEHLTHVDIEVRLMDGRNFVLERVDTDKIRYLCRESEIAKHGK